MINNPNLIVKCKGCGKEITVARKTITFCDENCIPPYFEKVREALDKRWKRLNNQLKKQRLPEIDVASFEEELFDSYEVTRSLRLTLEFIDDQHKPFIKKEFLSEIVAWKKYEFSKMISRDELLSRLRLLAELLDDLDSSTLDYIRRANAASKGKELP